MYKIYKDLILKYKNQFIKNKYILGMMIIGSVARETSSKISDLDIVVLRKNECKKTFMDFYDNGILVEIHSLTHDQLMDRLISGKKSYYAMIEGVIIFSKEGSLEKIKEYSKNNLEKYKYTNKEKKDLKRYLEIIKIKVNAALSKNDKIQANFILSVILWKIVEGIFLVNSRPVPSNGAALFYLYKLKNKPDIKEIVTFLTGSNKDKRETGINLIEWVLKRIK